jgi:WD40 repeat protein
MPPADAGLQKNTTADCSGSGTDENRNLGLVNAREISRQAVCLTCGSPDAVNACAIHPQHPSTFAVPSQSRFIRIWNAETAQQVGHAIQCSSLVTSLAFSRPRGRYIAAGLCSGAVEVYARSRDRIAVATIAPRKPAPVAALMFSSTGDELACACGLDVVLMRFDARAAKASEECSVLQQYRICRGHSATVASLDFTVDGAVLCSCCNACEVCFLTNCVSLHNRLSFLQILARLMAYCPTVS